jgi:hypothetical protein
LLGGVAADATLSDSKACATREKLITALTHSGTSPQLIADFARLPNTILTRWVYMSMNAPGKDDDPATLMRLKLSAEEAVCIQRRLRGQSAAAKKARALSAVSFGKLLAHKTDCTKEAWCNTSVAGPTDYDIPDRVTLAVNPMLVIVSLALGVDHGCVMMRNQAARVEVNPPVIGGKAWDAVWLEFGARWPVLPTRAMPFNAKNQKACLLGGPFKSILALVGADGKLFEENGKCLLGLKHPGMAQTEDEADDEEDEGKSLTYNPLVGGLAGAGGDKPGPNTCFVWHDDTVGVTGAAVPLNEMEGDRDLARTACRGHPGNGFVCQENPIVTSHCYGFADDTEQLWCLKCSGKKTFSGRFPRFLYQKCMFTMSGSGQT